MTSHNIDLPTEISLKIADYLSPRDISKCYGLNHIFLELALDARYGRITFGHEGNPRTFFWMMRRVW